ncbi:hypothetical protein PR003_g11020 [Phytophthora rubi]|uniref:Secreted protein n=3 Tax=Phytophthora TaxID=4783 RepID=A0A6A4F9F4_9STRA|nr:hypothetical protein PF006_g33497 [Phytophthora fragariae]KAE9339424.1 hypothetical protein PR003_g11020 [Phytophthora rubi]
MAALTLVLVWEELAALVSAAVLAGPLVSEEQRVSAGTAVLVQVPMWAALLAELRALVEMEAQVPVPVWEELAVRASALVPAEMLALP